MAILGVKRLVKSATRRLGCEPISWHETLLESLAKTLSPTLYVEIGIYEARTFNRVAPFCGKAIAVDISEAALCHVRGKNSLKVHGTSRDLRGHELLLAKQAIDLAFIDGNHDSTEVVDDFYNVAEHCAPRALICLHDTFPCTEEDTARERCSDSFLVPEMLRKEVGREWNYITIPRHPGLTIFSRTAQLPEWFRPAE